MRKAIVIGATSGIGKGLALTLAEHDYLVGITGRRTEFLDELKAQNPSRFFTKTFDITDLHNIATHLEALTNQLDGLDLLILSSGTGDLNDALDFEIEKRTIDTNVTGFTCVADWAFNYFQNQKSGHLVAISSVGGLRGNRVAPAYNATKAYQINYLEGLRQKATNLNAGIVITDVRPGFVDTAMAKGDGQFWVAPVEKASKQIFEAIMKKKKIAYVTKRWGIVAAILKRIPRQIFDKM
ncbi:MAG: SDR family NAD(P)-dependent oxidoreductase [Bacteroidia bacterium]|nr:SDR family NAD(P)-dependent oxidoreductase [Bacteroidia bacterium]